MNSAVRNGIGTLLSCCGAVYGAIVGACAPVWLLATIDGMVASEAFTLIAWALTAVLIAIGAIAGLVIGALAGWNSFRGLATLTARANISPQLAERRQHAYRPLAVVAGVGAFLVLHQAIAASFSVIALLSVGISANQPMPLDVSVLLTIGTLVASTAIAVWTWQLLERRFLARELAATATEPPVAVIDG